MNCNVGDIVKVTTDRFRGQKGLIGTVTKYDEATEWYTIKYNQTGKKFTGREKNSYRVFDITLLTKLEKVLYE